MHEAVSVDIMGIFCEHELSLEFGHLSEKRHLSWKVKKSPSRKIPTYKEGSLSASRGPCGTEV